MPQTPRNQKIEPSAPEVDPIFNFFVSDDWNWVCPGAAICFFEKSKYLCNRYPPIVQVISIGNKVTLLNQFLFLKELLAIENYTCSTKVKNSKNRPISLYLHGDQGATPTTIPRNWGGFQGIPHV